MESPHATLPELKDMTACVEKLTQEGYTNNFRATEDGLVCNETNETFQPEQVKISNFFRFEGMSDPDDNAILYAIETSSGLKGTLADGYGAFSNTDVNEFIKNVENITKKNAVSPES